MIDKVIALTDSDKLEWKREGPGLWMCRLKPSDTHLAIKRLQLLMSPYYGGYPYKLEKIGFFLRRRLSKAVKRNVYRQQHADKLRAERFRNGQIVKLQSAFLGSPGSQQIHQIGE